MMVGVKDTVTVLQLIGGMRSFSGSTWNVSGLAVAGINDSGFNSTSTSAVTAFRLYSLKQVA